jgi:hypothetical protein
MNKILDDAGTGIAIVVAIGVLYAIARFLWNLCNLMIANIAPIAIVFGILLAMFIVFWLIGWIFRKLFK